MKSGARDESDTVMLTKRESLDDVLEFSSGFLDLFSFPEILPVPSS